ncbi:hypothetical protein GDO81_025828 [Engystomops pustulosus]|uniref:Uncharacterized protein n=1 Tax=Engystomops pustulosus TaxID=76066 RepID=A0AAV6YPI8_ENGPU|nr:hypothetical protein GDO81_025828 [Engystomops pustulosus]
MVALEGYPGTSMHIHISLVTKGSQHPIYKAEEEEERRHLPRPPASSAPLLGDSTRLEPTLLIRGFGKMV